MAKIDKTLEINIGKGVLYYKLILVGGRDDEGEYEIVLEGPAAGEKVYLDE